MKTQRQIHTPHLLMVRSYVGYGVNFLILGAGVVDSSTLEAVVVDSSML